MAIIDITQHILDTRNLRKDIVTWLVEHVGPYYGRGDHPVIDVGSGWEIVVQYEQGEDPGDDIIIGWAVDITDEAKSTMFALRWA